MVKQNLITTVHVEIDGERLGLNFQDDGDVSSVLPGCEAEAKGMGVGDRIVQVGATQVTDRTSIIEAIRGHAKRHMHLSVQRPFDPEALDYVEVEFDGPKLGISFGDDGRVDSVMPGGEAMAKGIHVGDRFTCVGPDPVGPTKAEVMAAIASHGDRPICLTMTRPHDASKSPPRQTWPLGGRRFCLGQKIE